MDKQIFEPFVAIDNLDSVVALLQYENLTLASRNWRLLEEVGELQRQLGAMTVERAALQDEVNRINAQWFSGKSRVGARWRRLGSWLSALSIARVAQWLRARRTRR